MFAEEQEADLIVVGATSRGPVARRMLGSNTTRLIERSRRPVLVITPPPRAEETEMAVAPEERGLFVTKPVDVLVADTEDSEHQLRRAVGALDLTALGLGAIIGTGIFVIIGEAITESGPAIVLSFVLAGVTCAFSALAFAELASTIPVAGSAYTYSYATMGELIAWIIGWDLILEYAVSVAAVAVGWGQYFNDLIDSLFGIALPESLAGPPGEGGTVNLPAVFIVLSVTAVLCYGIRESARANTVMVVIKLAVLALFIALGVTAFTADNLTPFAPEGGRRRRDRRVADLLRLHRLRRGVDLGRGDEEPEPRPPDRDRRLARDRHRAVHHRRARRRRRAAVRPAGRRRGAARDGAGRGRRLQLGRRHHLVRRARRDHERRADDPLRPDADHVRDVPRRADARGASPTCTPRPGRRSSSPRRSAS